MGLSSAEAERVSILLGRDYAFAEETISDPLKFVEGSSVFLSLFQRNLFYAGFSRRQARLLLTRCVVWLLLGILGALIFHSSFILFFSAAVVNIESRLLALKRRARVKEFNQDYCAFLLSIASSVKTGADPLSAMSQAENLFPNKSVISQEIKKFKEDIERGLTEEDSLKRFAKTIADPDIDLFRSAMILARKEGSALGECLQRLARVTRQRQSFTRKVKSAVAMQKMASMGIAGCTVIIGLIQYFANPDALKKAWAHPAGHTILMFGLILIMAGLLWMRRLSSREL